MKAVIFFSISYFWYAETIEPGKKGKSSFHLNQFPGFLKTTFGKKLHFLCY